MGEARRRLSGIADPDGFRRGPDGLTTRHRETACTVCGHKVNGATAVPGNEKARLTPGSFGMCIQCGHWMVYTDDLGLRDPTKEELAELAAHPEVQRAGAALAKAKGIWPETWRRH
jgi:hypothetical protein